MTTLMHRWQGTTAEAALAAVYQRSESECDSQAKRSFPAIPATNLRGRPPGPP